MTITAPDSVRLDDQPRLYKVDAARKLLSMSRSVIYDQMRAGRLRSVHQGRSRLIPDTAIRDYIALLEKEAEEAA